MQNHNIVTAEYFGKHIVGVIEYDSDPVNPREDWDSISTLACWHSRYNLGDSGKGGWSKGRRDSQFDEHEFKAQLLDEAGFARDLVQDDEVTDEEGYYDQDKYGELWDERADKLIEENVVMTPLSLYDHSGISISTGSFSCPWDSGQVGYGYITLEKARSELSLPEATLDTLIPKNEWNGTANVEVAKWTVRDWAISAIRSDVKVYDSYLRGEVYALAIYDFHGVEDADFDSPDRLDFDDAELLESCSGFFEESSCLDEMREAARRIADERPEQLELI